MRVIRIVALLASLGAGLALASSALAQEAGLPTPRGIIYPGDIIYDNMLAEQPADKADGPGPFVRTRAGLIGKMARRTLLPGVAVPDAAIDNQRLVVNGGDVELVYSQGGLTIVAAGSALQDGAAGDVIKVRNSDSGVTVTGTIQSDGTVRVSGG
jgi:flagella basal body P-ring formation protein FlgA